MPNKPPKPFFSAVTPMGMAKNPWSLVHVNYARPFLGSMFLVIVDTHSKWIEVYNTGQASTGLVTVCNCDTFYSTRTPRRGSLRYGPCFTSSVFTEFMRQNGIQHIKVAPYHPASNVLAERAVQTFKAGVKKRIVGTLEDWISRFLFAYRTPPHTTTGVSPTEILIGRKLKTRLELIRPVLEERVTDRQTRQKEGHDRTARDRVLQAGDTIYARNHNEGVTWVPAKMVEGAGPLSFRCQWADQRIVRKHHNQIRHRELQNRRPK